MDRYRANGRTTFARRPFSECKRERNHGIFLAEEVERAIFSPGQ